jgi:hypothetical protein
MIKPVVVKQIDSVDIRRYLREHNIDVDLYDMCGECNNGETWNIELLVDPAKLDPDDEICKPLIETITQAPYNNTVELDGYDIAELQLFLSWLKYHGHLDCSYDDYLQFHMWW